MFDWEFWAFSALLIFGVYEHTYSEKLPGQRFGLAFLIATSTLLVYAELHEITSLLVSLVPLE